MLQAQPTSVRYSTLLCKASFLNWSRSVHLPRDGSILVINGVSVPSNLTPLPPASISARLKVITERTATGDKDSNEDIF